MCASKKLSGNFISSALYCPLCALSQPLTIAATCICFLTCALAPSLHAVGRRWQAWPQVLSPVGPAGRSVLAAGCAQSPARGPASVAQASLAQGQSSNQQSAPTNAIKTNSQLLFPYAVTKNLIILLIEKSGK